jgi:hypothetical protein
LPPRIENGASSVTTVQWGRCGPGWVFRGGFRDRWGRWVPGRCVPFRSSRSFYRPWGPGPWGPGWR